MVGDLANFTCFFNNSDEVDVNYTWFRNATAIGNKANMSIIALRNDSWQYACQVRYDNVVVESDTVKMAVLRKFIERRWHTRMLQNYCILP